MNEAEMNALSAMRDIWISGGAARSQVPAEWHAIIAGTDGDEAERLLLAVAGQALEAAFRPAAPGSLVRRAGLPQLTLPGLPDRLRPLFRSALRYAADKRGRTRVVALAEARGFAAHPLDWMPAATDLDAPRLYTPWIDWLGEERTADVQLDALTVDSWDQFYPAARRMALADIRRVDPARARALLEAKAAGEPAEKRLALVDLLQIGLSGADAPYLESLAGDRSDKVRQLAARFLSRLGKAHSSTQEDVRELAEFIEQAKAGLLRRRIVYKPKALKTPAQERRRAELFGGCTLGDLAARFSADELDFIAGWQFEPASNVDVAFAGMVAETGSDAAAAALVKRLLDEGHIAAVRPLIGRMPADALRAAVVLALAGDGTEQWSLVDWAGIEAGAFRKSELMASTAYKSMRAQLVTARREADGRPPDFSLFGFLADAGAAQAIVADLTAAGMAFADPALALLRLNASLDAPEMTRGRPPT